MDIAASIQVSVLAGAMQEKDIEHLAQAAFMTNQYDAATGLKLGGIVQRFLFGYAEIFQVLQNVICLPAIRARDMINLVLAEVETAERHNSILRKYLFFENTGHKWITTHIREESPFHKIIHRLCTHLPIDTDFVGQKLLNSDFPGN